MQAVRLVLRYLRTVYGNWEVLAKQLKFDTTTVVHVVDERRAVSTTMAFRVARLARISIDGLLAGRYQPPKDACDCGFKPKRPPRKIFAS